ncbi:MAG: arsenate reductase ArsC [Armatimonadetes bacterium]|nr:arsenate reductase ArsC [Armatimonadota bacterium]
MKQVLFVCVHNSGRSQMAEAFVNALSRGKVRGISAGTQPGGSLNPMVVQAMEEIGVSMATHHPKVMTEEMIAASDRIITMGCGVEESCPAGFVSSEDWGLDDPKGQPIEKVRRIRDQVKERVAKLLADEA